MNTRTVRIRYDSERVRRSKGYYIRTMLFTILMVLIVFLQRCETVPYIPSILYIGDFSFSTSDFFMIIAAGIGGYICGTLAFSILFVLEILTIQGFMIRSLFSLFVYLVIVLMSGYFARKRWYRGIWRPCAAIAAFTLVLGSSLYILMTYMLDERQTTAYSDYSILEMHISIIPEIVLAVIVLTMVYRFVPDRIKEGIGEGYLYTLEYQEYLDNRYDTGRSLLARRVFNLVMIQTIVISLIAIAMYNLQMSGMRKEGIQGRMPVFSSSIQMFLLISCVTIPFAMIINEIVARLLVKPLNKMTLVMRQYFAEDNSDRHHYVGELMKLNIHTGDEVEELYKSMCLMVEDMSDYIDVIQREMELRENLEAAEAESKAKSAFLSSMSHEIRTPINAVLGLDEMILRESGEPRILKYAEDIRTAGDSLLGLINDILDFSKIEAGKMDIIPVEYDFASVLNDLVNMVKQRAENKNLRLDIDVDSNIPSLLYGDEIRFKQIVTNILTNAVKYTEKGGITLRLRSEKLDDENISLYVSVKDTGIGIKEEDIEKLYSAFERIEEKRNRNIEGTGLGMNITRHLLEMMGSSLNVSSIYGEGSDFSFILKQKVVKWEPIGDFEEALKRFYATRKKYHKSFTAPTAKILAVDDTLMNLTVLKGLLKQTGLQVFTASGGEECLEKVTEMKYDIIFLDHRMPGKDGVETLKEMKTLSDNLNTDTPVIALTANAVSGAREEYIGYGFTDYLTKPIDYEALEKMIVKYLPEDKLNTADDIEESYDNDFEEFLGEEFSEEDEDYYMDIDSLPDIEGIDWKYASLHMPDTGLIRSAVQDFYNVINIHADKLDSYYSNLPGDDAAWEEYRILVHGMKSSAAIIGIISSSGLARMLETASRDKDYDTVGKLHDVFIKEWRTYNDRLKGLFGLGKEDDLELNEYDPAVVSELVGRVKDSMEEFDTDSADEAVDILKQYRYPDDISRLIEQLAGAVADVDTDSVSEIADELLRIVR